ncbi:MAG TPA: hypothetical protein VK876_13535 [Rubrivivax sp.]|nr:hypothetical protein [Rubrivivax sp.]
MKLQVFERVGSAGRLAGRCIGIAASLPAAAAVPIKFSERS